MSNVVDINGVIKRELTSKFTQYKLDQWESSMRKSGEDITVLELTGIGELIQAIAGGTAAGALGIDPKIVRILSTNRMITLIMLGNASYDREKATAKLESYLEVEDNSILSAWLDLIIELDMDLKLFRSFGLDVKSVKSMFRKAKKGMSSMIMNSKAFEGITDDEDETQETHETQSAETVDNVENNKATPNTEGNYFGI